ncbi:MAG: nucleotidyl transferase AbiEii/AbiGii toxin family protein [Pirellulales bacterium]|nr:nucleotidyl transferase AbiEii/AbiGii toxin family protein [Pirellulales bacterium]
MGKSFKTAAAFRTSLEERLKQVATQRDVQINSLRLKVVIERLLARLFAIKDPPWLLKGGYAMELRYRPRARTTKDIDLSVRTGHGELAARLEEIRDELQEAAELDLGDYFVFQIAQPSSELQGAPDGGARFPVTALLAGRTFAKFHLDIGFGDPISATPEELVGQDFLGFAGVAPAKVLAVPKAQQFAEKLHAYTLPWTDRPNTRTKDLVDLVLFVTIDPPAKQAIRAAIEATFRLRNTHPVPSELPPPPEAWRTTLSAMANDASLATTDLDEGFRLVAEFYQDVLNAQ